MKKIHVLAAATMTAVSLLAFRSFAGQKRTDEITVIPSLRTAMGSMGDARNSGDANQSIGCVVAVYGSDGEGLSAYCTAQDKNGAFAYCYFPSTTIDTYVKVLQSIQPNSRFYFTWDASYRCVDLEVHSESSYRPLTP